MRCSILSIVCCFVVMFTLLGSCRSYPATLDQAEVVEIVPINDKETVETEQQLIERNKRTIGVLRQLFPGLSQDIDEWLKEIITYAVQVAADQIFGGDRRSAQAANQEICQKVDDKVKELVEYIVGIAADAILNGGILGRTSVEANGTTIQGNSAKITIEPVNKTQPIRRRPGNNNNYNNRPRNFNTVNQTVNNRINLTVYNNSTENNLLSKARQNSNGILLPTNNTSNDNNKIPRNKRKNHQTLHKIGIGNESFIIIVNNQINIGKHKHINYPLTGNIFDTDLSNKTINQTEIKTDELSLGNETLLLSLEPVSFNLTGNNNISTENKTLKFHVQLPCGNVNVSKLLELFNDTKALNFDTTEPLVFPIEPEDADDSILSAPIGMDLINKYGNITLVLDGDETGSSTENITIRNMMDASVILNYILNIDARNVQKRDVSSSDFNETDETSEESNEGLLFPINDFTKETLYQIVKVDMVVQEIVAYLFRIISRQILSGGLFGGGGGGSSSGSSSGSSGTVSAGTSSGSGGSRVSITLPTYPPDLEGDDDDDDDDADSASSGSSNVVSNTTSTSDNEVGESTVVQSVTNTTSRRRRDDHAAQLQTTVDNEDNALSGAESQHNEVRVRPDNSAAADDQQDDHDQEAAASGGNGPDPEEDLDNVEDDDENRNKRFLSFGVGGDASGSAGGSGNFLFDIIRSTADRAARAVGTAYRLVAGTETLGLGLTATSSHTNTLVPTGSAQPAPAKPQGLLQWLVAGSGSTEAGDQAANGPLDGKADYQEAVPGPVTRLFVIANRGISNLVQDLILRLAQTSEKLVNFKARLITSLI